MGQRDTFTAQVPQVVKEHENFTRWMDKLDGSLLIRIESALNKIEASGLITDVKALKDGLYEKKWNNGLRLYFAVVEEDGRKTLLVLGSGKDREQDMAIKKSKKILNDYCVIKDDLRYDPN